MSFSRKIPLAAGLMACTAPIEPLDIVTEPSALCSDEQTLLDQMDTSERLGDWIDKSLDDGLTPGLDIQIDRDAMDLPEDLDRVIPGDLEAFGLVAYLSDPEGRTYLTALRSDGSFFFYEPDSGATCDDLSFAYRIKSFPVDLSVTGKCDWSNEKLTCHGSFYDSCAIKTESPVGPYDCKVLANYEGATGESFTLSID